MSSQTLCEMDLWPHADSMVEVIGGVGNYTNQLPKQMLTFCWGLKNNKIFYIIHKEKYFQNDKYFSQEAVV